MFAKVLTGGSSANGIFEVVKNTSGATLAKGDVVCWDYTNTDGGDGYQVKLATAAADLNAAPAGVVVSTSVADDGTAIIQMWGHCPYVKVSTNGGALGYPLGLISTDNYLTTVVALASNVTIAPYQVKVLGIQGAPYTTGKTTLATSHIAEAFLKFL